MLAIILLPPYDGYCYYYIYLLDDDEVCAIIVSAMAPPRDKTLRLFMPADDSFIDCYSMPVLLFFC